MDILCSVETWFAVVVSEMHVFAELACVVEASVSEVTVAGADGLDARMFDICFCVFFWNGRVGVD